MAPPTPVYDKFDISSKYRKQLSDPDKYQCTKKTITQHECTFKIQYPNHVPEVICLPFNREFQRCLFPTTVLRNGRKTTIEKWVNIEITDENTNQNIFTNPKYEVTVKEFLQADKDLKKMLEETGDV